ncbi:MAG: hypothetical protein ACI4WW_08080, partial [Candidatus Coprovivens sp.]
IRVLSVFFSVYFLLTSLNINDVKIETSGNSISNTGKMQMNSGSIKSSNNYAINTTGQYIINDGTVISDNSDAIYMNGGSNSEINGGTVTAKNTAILNRSGAITINDGNFTSLTGSAYSIGLYNYANATINGGTFTGKTHGLESSDMCSGIWCDSPHGSLLITGGTFTGEKNGANLTYRSATITGGTFKGDQYGIYNKTTLTLGTKNNNSESINIQSPRIIGGTYGLYNSGDTYYYDGKIYGKTMSYNNEFKEIERYSKKIIDTDMIDEEVYYVTYLILNDNQLYNVEKNNYYNDLINAINEADENDTIQLTNNVYYYESVSINSDKKIIIDLNGFDIFFSKTLENKGEISIKNSSDTKSTIKTAFNINLINNKNILNVENISLYSSSSSYIITNSGTLNINNIELNGNYGINNDNIMNIDNSNIKTTNNSIQTSKNFNLKNSTIYSSGYYSIYDSNSNKEIETSITNSTLNKIYQYNSSNYIIKDSIITNLYSVSNSNGKSKIINSTIDASISNTGTIEIYDSEYESNFSLSTSNQNINAFVNNGTMKIDNSSIIAGDITHSDNQSSYGITIINNTGNLILNNVDMSVSEGSGFVRGIYNKGTIDYTKSNINLNKGYLTTGIINYENGTINIKSGTIDIETSYTSYGIKNENGTTTLGEKESTDSANYGTSNANVSLTNPSIKAIGTTSGIGVKIDNGYFNYYDGKVTGSTSSIPDTISEVEYNYERVNYTDDDGYQYSILEYMK